MAFITKEINSFVTYPTVKRTKRCNAICHNKILECELDDGSIRYYWTNTYNLEKLTRYFGKKDQDKKIVFIAKGVI